MLIDFKMKIYLKKFKKINIVRWCPCCDQGWVVIVKDTADGKLYCRCEETYLLWESPEDVEPEWNRFVCDMNIRHHDFMYASEDEIIQAGWQFPLHRVTMCPICSSTRIKTSNPHIAPRRFSWITIKKSLSNGKLFCRCDTCGSTWADIHQAFRRTPPQDIACDTFGEATDEEIASVGWDAYKDVIFENDN